MFFLLHISVYNYVSSVSQLALYITYPTMQSLLKLFYLN